MIKKEIKTERKMFRLTTEAKNNIEELEGKKIKILSTLANIAKSKIKLRKVNEYMEKINKEN